MADDDFENLSAEVRKFEPTLARAVEYLKKLKDPEAQQLARDLEARGQRLHGYR